MADKQTNLHPKNDSGTNLKPNIIGDNIPSGSISYEKLNEVLKDHYDKTILDDHSNLDYQLRNADDAVADRIYTIIAANNTGYTNYPDGAIDGFRDLLITLKSELNGEFIYVQYFINANDVYQRYKNKGAPWSTWDKRTVTYEKLNDALKDHYDKTILDDHSNLDYQLRNADDAVADRIYTIIAVDNTGYTNYPDGAIDGFRDLLITLKSELNGEFIYVQYFINAYDVYQRYKNKGAPWSAWDKRTVTYENQFEHHYISMDGIKSGFNYAAVDMIFPMPSISDSSFAIRGIQKFANTDRCGILIYQSDTKEISELVYGATEWIDDCVDVSAPITLNTAKKYLIIMLRIRKPESTTIGSYRIDNLHVWINGEEIIPTDVLKDTLSGTWSDYTLDYSFKGLGYEQSYINPVETVSTPRALYNAVKRLRNIPNAKIQLAPNTTFDFSGGIDGVYDSMILGNGITIEGSTNSKLYCKYTGSDVNVAYKYSIFRSSPKVSGGFTLRNVNIEVYNIRYAVHDEKEGDIQPYHNNYINCQMYVNQTDNPITHNYRQCIGGGLGQCGDIYISGCKFESVDSTFVPSDSMPVIPEVSYHNAGKTLDINGDVIDAHGRSHITIEGNYFEHSARVTYYGEQTAMSVALISNNSMSHLPWCTKETDDANTVNMTLYEWNNHIRS